MAHVTIMKISPKRPLTVHREASRSRLVAHKVGIDIPHPQPSLPEAEQEETDIA